MRGFEKVSLEEYSKTRNASEYQDIVIPKRGTYNSAGYDFYMPYDLELSPYQSAVISMGIRAFMGENEVLLLFIRSSMGIRNGIRLQNQVGVIDSDYYGNPKNEGHIMIAIENTKDEPVILKKHDRVVQGIFLNYLKADNEEFPESTRQGGIGSTH
jgi:dUTP pyrophosphatase